MGGGGYGYRECVGVLRVQRMSLENEVKDEEEPFTAALRVTANLSSASQSVVPGQQRQRDLGMRLPLGCAHGSPEGLAKRQTLIPEVWVGPESLCFFTFPRGGRRGWWQATLG